MAHRTLLARRQENGTYDLGEQRAPSTGDPTPVATALSRVAVFEFVDFRVHEAVVVRHNGSETTYLAVPFTIPTADERHVDGGACIALRPGVGLSEAYLRGWIHAAKGTLGDAIDHGLLTERAARAYFADRIRAFDDTTEVYCRS